MARIFKDFVAKIRLNFSDSLGYVAIDLQPKKRLAGSNCKIDLF